MTQLFGYSLLNAELGAGKDVYYTSSFPCIDIYILYCQKYQITVIISKWCYMYFCSISTPLHAAFFCFFSDSMFTHIAEVATQSHVN